MNLTCIFDWDGIIIDSSEHHILGWKRIAKKENRVFPEHLFKQSFGMKNKEIIPQLWQWTNDPAEIARIDLEKEAAYRDIVREQGLIALPGIEKLLSELNESGVACVIGSSAPLANLTTGLEILGFHRYFKSIVSGEDAKLGKPDPQIFLVAASRVNADPSSCIVFEDAIVGVAAARAACMKVVAVTNTYPAEKLADADLIVDSLLEIHIDRLTALLNS